MPRPRATAPTYSLVQRGHGTWYVQWWEAGKSQRTSCRTADQGQARRFREELIASLLTPHVPETPTIGDVMDGYKAAREGKVHSDAIEYTSRALKRHMAHLPADQITPEYIDSYLSARRREGPGGVSAPHRAKARKGKPLSDGTLRRELGVLRTALGWAVGKKWLVEVPAFDLPPTQPARKRWLTKAEARARLEGARYLHVKTFLALALFTAGRHGAILDLTWDRVDMEAGTIHLATGESRGRKRRATVPIADELRPYLIEARLARTCPYVVERRSEKVASVKVGVRAAAERGGVIGATPHVLRHTAATWMLQAGVPIKMVADYLGDTVQMIEKHYGQHSPTWLREGAAALNLRA